MRDVSSNTSRAGFPARFFMSLAVAGVAFALTPQQAVAQLLVPADEGGGAQGADPGGDGDIAGEQPSGMWVGGGFSMLANDGTLAGMRAEFGIPLSDDIPLSLVIPLTFHGRRNSFAGGVSKFRLLTVLPALQYEFLLPIDMPGQLTVVGEIGLGFALLNAKFVNDFGPNNSDTNGAFGIHAAVIARYYFESVPALFVAVQPVGVMGLIRDNGAGYYEFYVGAGYRFGQ